MSNGENMIEDLQISDEYRGAFRRLVKRMPVEFQTEETFLQALVMYLKLGGEKLARQRIEVEKAEFETEFRIVKKQPIPEPVNRESAAGDEGSDEENDKDSKDVKDVKDGTETRAADEVDSAPA